MSDLSNFKRKKKSKHAEETTDPSNSKRRKKTKQEEETVNKQLTNTVFQHSDLIRNEICIIPIVGDGNF